MTYKVEGRLEYEPRDRSTPGTRFSDINSEFSREDVIRAGLKPREELPRILEFDSDPDIAPYLTKLFGQTEDGPVVSGTLTVYESASFLGQEQLVGRYDALDGIFMELVLGDQPRSRFTDENGKTQRVNRSGDKWDKIADRPGHIQRQDQYTLWPNLR